MNVEEDNIFETIYLILSHENNEDERKKREKKNKKTNIQRLYVPTPIAAGEKLLGNIGDK